MKTSYSKILENPRRLAVVDLTDYYGHGLIITRINVPAEHRRKGIGNELLKQVIADADREKVNLFLEINSYGGMSYDDLQLWYERNGFTNMFHSGVFVRRPK